MSSSSTLKDGSTPARTVRAGRTDKIGRPYAEELRSAKCPEVVITAVRALTKHPGEPRDQAVARAATNPIARAIKRADVGDNSDPDRLALLGPATGQGRCHRYDESILLLDHLTTPFHGTADEH